MATELGSLLEELAAKHNVPGAAIAVLDGGKVTEAATGVINKNTGVETTIDSVFQIGSISKVWTTTIILQLLDEGKVELDSPVRDYLPELKLADPEATESITVRQLLTHTSGIDGDHFADTGRGDDCIKEYVATCASLPQTAPPGKFFSYCNAGFVIAGRLIEEITGQTWDAALKERVIAPLGLKHTVTLPEEAILHRAAVGHIDPDNSGNMIVCPAWVLPRSLGPAGLICSTPAEVIAFAQMHLNGGKASDGTAVLSSESATAMQQQEVEIPDKYTLGGGWGLGWILYDWDGKKLIGHDGGTLGQLAFLRVLPEENFAICLLTNGLTGSNLAKELFETVFDERFGINVPGLPQPATEPVEFDPELFAGVYERTNYRSTVEVEDGGLVYSLELSGPAAGMMPPIVKEPLKPIDDKAFLMRLPLLNEDVAIVFFDFDESGRPRYYHSGGRATPRVG